MIVAPYAIVIAMLFSVPGQSTTTLDDGGIGHGYSIDMCLNVGLDKIRAAVQLYGDRIRSITLECRPL